MLLSIAGSYLPCDSTAEAVLRPRIAFIVIVIRVGVLNVRGLRHWTFVTFPGQIYRADSRVAVPKQAINMMHALNFTIKDAKRHATNGDWIADMPTPAVAEFSVIPGDHSKWMRRRR